VQSSPRRGARADSLDSMAWKSTGPTLPARSVPPDKHEPARDHYGGLIADRARLLLRVTDAAAAIWGRVRVGVHLGRAATTPRWAIRIRRDVRPCRARTGRRGIAFLCGANRSTAAFVPRLRQAFGGVVIANEGFTHETAERVLAAGEADAVAFGHLFIANRICPGRFACVRRSSAATRHVQHARPGRLRRLSDARRSAALPVNASSAHSTRKS